MTNVPITTTSPSEQTSLELVSEAVEDLANAVVDARMLPDRPTRSMVDNATKRVVDARSTLSHALGEFLKPKLRVIEGGAQPYAEGTQEADKPRCRICNSTTPCATPSCRHWARAIRLKASEVLP